MSNDNSDENLALEISTLTGIEFQRDSLQNKLSDYINQLIASDFSLLISLLYRIDVSEPKLRKLLKDSATADAGKIIASLMIERQLAKIHSRKTIVPDNKLSDEERW